MSAYTSLCYSIITYIEPYTSVCTIIVTDVSTPVPALRVSPWKPRAPQLPKLAPTPENTEPGEKAGSDVGVYMCICMWI